MTREEAVNVFRNIVPIESNEEYAKNITEAISMAIEALQDEAVQGEWGHMIADGSDGSHWYEYECSHCGEIVLRPYNFCPNCGANMEGGNDTTGKSL